MSSQVRHPIHFSGLIISCLAIFHSFGKRKSPTTKNTEQPNVYGCPLSIFSGRAPLQNGGRQGYPSLLSTRQTSLHSRSVNLRLRGSELAFMIFLRQLYPIWRFLSKEILNSRFETCLAQSYDKNVRKSSIFILDKIFLLSIYSVSRRSVRRYSV